MSATNPDTGHVQRMPDGSGLRVAYGIGAGILALLILAFFTAPFSNLLGPSKFAWGLSSSIPFQNNGAIAILPAASGQVDRAG